ncbi:MAG TPA: hypothetical protein VLQ47_03850, partial [Rhodoferax sp.]|nr:hypothetical protein [Rhodoferax sp.]
RSAGPQSAERQLAVRADEGRGSCWGTVAFCLGVATLALGLALVVRIRESYDTIEEDEILDQDTQSEGDGNPT